MIDPNLEIRLKKKLKEELKEMVEWYDYETKRKRQKLPTAPRLFFGGILEPSVRSRATPPRLHVG